jgi:hypothetical protein
MSITCKASNVANDVRCAVCGQSFLVYWKETSPVERAQQYAAVLSVLRRHHAAMSSERAHPAGEFCVCSGPQLMEAPLMFPVAAPVAA